MLFKIMYTNTSSCVTSRKRPEHLLTITMPGHINYHVEQDIPSAGSSLVTAPVSSGHCRALPQARLWRAVASARTLERVRTEQRPIISRHAPLCKASLPHSFSSAASCVCFRSYQGSTKQSACISSQREWRGLKCLLLKEQAI